MGRRQYRSQAEWSTLMKQQAQSELSGARLFKRRGLVAEMLLSQALASESGQGLGSGGPVFCSGIARVVDINPNGRQSGTEISTVCSDLSVVDKIRESVRLRARAYCNGNMAALHYR